MRAAYPSGARPGRFQRGPCASVDGIRDAARNRKAAHVATDAAKDASEYSDNATMRTAMAALNAVSKGDDAPPPPRKVTGARFGRVMASTHEDPAEGDALSGVIEDFDRASGFDPRHRPFTSGRKPTQQSGVHNGRASAHPSPNPGASPGWS